MASKRTVAWVVVVILAAVTGYYWAQSTGGERRPKSPTRVAFITGGAGPFWQLVISGAQAAADDHGAKLGIMAADDGADSQLRELTAIDATKYDGLAISALHPDSLSGLLSRLSEQLNVVTFDSDAPNSNRLCYIGTNNHAAGALCAELVKDALPEGGKIVLLFANLDKHNAVLRHQGFVDEFERTTTRDPSASAGDEYQLLETMHDNIDEEKCAANIKQALADHPDLDCFVGMFGYHGPILLEARAAGDIPDTVKLVVFDEDQRVLQGIEDGVIYGTVIQDPYKYGYESVRMLIALHAGRSNELPIANRGSLFLPCEMVTADNVAEFRERLSRRSQP